jgi:hypothetical protein
MAGGQYRAMRHGVGGILGNLGNVESASCTFQRWVEEANPTLSADKLIKISILWHKYHLEN